MRFRAPATFEEAETPVGVMDDSTEDWDEDGTTDVDDGKETEEEGDTDVVAGDADAKAVVRVLPVCGG
jgi:hypothetical protein